MSVSAFCLFADLMAFLHIAFPGIILWSVSIYIDCLTSSFTDATRLAIVTTALLFSSCVAPFSKSFFAYHKMKSSSLMLSRTFLLVQYVSGSFFFPPVARGISFTVTSNPFSSASRALLITALMPVPYGSSGFGGSASGRKHSFVVNLFSIFI